MRRRWLTRASYNSCYCDNDSDNYQVWVGTYSETSEVIPSRVGARELGRGVG